MSWKLIEKNRRRLEREEGTQVKDHGGKLTVALVYPNTYYIGMSNLAVHALYKMINDRRDMVCERAFLPDRLDMEQHRRTGTPVLTIESQSPISKFDIIAFTVSFENDLPNIPCILDMSNIELESGMRKKDSPSIIAGGAAVSINPRALSRTADLCIPGEFEAYDLEEIINSIGENPTVMERRTCATLDDFPTQTAIHTPDTEFGRMHLIEVTRGCSRGCLFCAVSGIYGQFRMRSTQAVIEMINHGFRYKDRFGLIGADILAHPGFYDIAEYILNREGSFSLSSVRVDRITPKAARLFRRTGMKSMSLGIEAATDRLRSRLGKKFTNRRCQESTAILASEGITNIRLYFMIGLPGETDEDIEAIASFAEETLKTIRKNAPKIQRSSSVECTITPFVPKPHTPFADADFAGIEKINAAQKRLKRMLNKKSGIRLSFDSAKQAESEYKLARTRDILSQ